MTVRELAGFEPQDRRLCSAYLGNNTMDPDSDLQIERYYAPMLPGPCLLDRPLEAQRH